MLLIIETGLLGVLQRPFFLRSRELYIGFCPVSCKMDHPVVQKLRRPVPAEVEQALICMIPMRQKTVYNDIDIRLYPYDLPVHDHIPDPEPEID